MSGLLSSIDRGKINQNSIIKLNVHVEKLMARKTKVYLIDDIDGSDATKAIEFSLDGVSYEIDLNDTHAEELSAAFEKWTTHARRSTTRRTRKTGKPRAASDAAKIRKWALENGYEISPRGRVPTEIREAYEQRAR